MNRLAMPVRKALSSGLCAALVLAGAPPAGAASSREAATPGASAHIAPAVPRLETNLHTPASMGLAPSARLIEGLEQTEQAAVPELLVSPPSDLPLRLIPAGQPLAQVRPRAGQESPQGAASISGPRTVEETAGGELAGLAERPEAAVRSFDGGGMGLRPAGRHPFPEIGHDPAPTAHKGASFFPLSLDSARPSDLRRLRESVDVYRRASGLRWTASGLRRLRESVDSAKYEAWPAGPAGAVILPGNPKDEAAVEKALRRFIADNPALFKNLGPKDFGAKVNLVKGAEGVDDAVYGHFSQIHNNLLVDGTSLDFTVKVYPEATVLFLTEAQLHPNLDMDTQGSLDQDQLRVKVLQRLGVPPLDWGSTPMSDQGRRIMHLGGRWRTVQAYMVEKKLTMVAVDVNTGEAFAWDPRVSMADGSDSEGTAAGRGVADGPQLEDTKLSELALGYLAIETSAGTVFADKDGKFTVPGKPGEKVKITTRLKGQRADIRDKSAKDMVIVTEAEAGAQLRVVFNKEGADEFQTAAVNLYYFITKAWDFTFRVLTKDILGVTIGNANLHQSCNAHYEPWGEHSVNTYIASTQCVNSSYSDVIPHETWHKVHDMARQIFLRPAHTLGSRLLRFFTLGLAGAPAVETFKSLVRIDDGALSEGHGDNAATYMTGQPIVGRKFLKGSKRDYIRNAEDPPHKYDPGDEVHDGGLPWMQFAWALRKELIKLYGEAKGLALAENLVFPVVFIARSVPHAIQSVLVRDTRKDGKAPHYELIRDLAARHDIEVKPPQGQEPSRPAASEAKPLKAAGQPSSERNGLEKLENALLALWGIPLSLFGPMAAGYAGSFLFASYHPDLAAAILGAAFEDLLILAGNIVSPEDASVLAVRLFAASVLVGPLLGGFGYFFYLGLH